MSSTFLTLALQAFFQYEIYFKMYQLRKFDSFFRKIEKNVLN